MAVNIPPKGDAHRSVAEKDRTHNPKTGIWIKRDSRTGKFMAVKMDGTPFEGAARGRAMDVIRKLKDK